MKYKLFGNISFHKLITKYINSAKTRAGVEDAFNGLIWEVLCGTILKQETPKEDKKIVSKPEKCIVM